MVGRMQRAPHSEKSTPRQSPGSVGAGVSPRTGTHGRSRYPKNLRTVAEYQSNAARVRRDPSRALPRQDTSTPVAMLNDAETLARLISRTPEPNGWVGTLQASSAQRIPRRAAALLEKIAAFFLRGYGPLFSPSTAAPSIQRLALTLVSDGACGFAGAGMLSVSAARQFV